MFLMSLSQKDSFWKCTTVDVKWIARKGNSSSLLAWMNFEVWETKQNGMADIFSVVFLKSVFLTRVSFPYYLILFVFVRMFTWSCNIKQHLTNPGRPSKHIALCCQSLRAHSSGFWWHTPPSGDWWLGARVCVLFTTSSVICSKVLAIAGLCHQLSSPLLPIHFWQDLGTQACQ